jgi:hypothetical protein
MYKIDRQMKIEDFIFPFGKLNKENEWVKLSEIIHWDKIEARYAKQFVNNGHPAHSARIALGALIIKQRLKCSDEWTVRHVSENPYLQYFIGMEEYSNKCPFGASTMVAFRKRFSEEDIADILEMSIPKPKAKAPGDDEANSGTLIMDATCCPADIAYPQDINLLNEARGKLEKIIDEICKANGLKKPRTYRKEARKEYLKVAKSKKRTGKLLKKGIKKQLQYIKRDIGYIERFIKDGVSLTAAQHEYMEVLLTTYGQQKTMHDNNTRSVPCRIVSLSQPHVRPITRGKAKAKTEFGAKLHISMVNGYARMERLDFEAYNEANDFNKIVEGYRERYGCYPERILADRIYRNRKTLQYCKERSIRVTGPALGRPPKDAKVTQEAKKQEYQDICDRNIIEGKIGTGKTAYGLGRIAARLENTSRCVIGIALLVMNLQKRLSSFLRQFLLCLYRYLDFCAA